MMDAAERHHKLVARLAAECARLHEPQMMRIGRFTGTQEARLLGDKSKMLLVAVAPGRADLSTLLSIRLDALVVAPSCAPISREPAAEVEEESTTGGSPISADWEHGDLLFKRIFQ